MSLPFVVRRAAQAEFDAGYDWYEQRRPGHGDVFAARIQEVFDQLAIAPLAHGVVCRDIRMAVVQQFPYCVDYRVMKKEIVIISVFHTPT